MLPDCRIVYEEEHVFRAPGSVIMLLAFRADMLLSIVCTGLGTVL